MNTDRNTKLHSYPVIAVFMLFIVGVLIASILTVPAEVSDKEQKKLAQRPLLAENSWDDFANAWENYVSDQFPGRNEVVDSYTKAELAQDKELVHDVYVLSDDYLFSYTYPVEDWKLETLTGVMNDRKAQSGIDATYIIVPQKNLVLEGSNVSVDASTDAANLKALKNALKYHKYNYIDCCSHLMSYSLQQRSKFFFKTDFHWNEYGAFIAAKYAAEQLASLGIIKDTSVPAESDFTWTNLTGKDYLGDLQKRFSDEVTVKEYLPVYTANNAAELHYYTDYNGAEVPRDTIVASGINDDVLDYNKLTTYNLGYLRVENPNAPEIKSVLILKDSYSCAMLEYLSQIFTEINIVDPRYVTDSLDNLLKNRDIDHMIYIYHESNVSSELIQYLKVE